MYDEFRLFLHRNHYLLLLLKRHIIVLSAADLAQDDMEKVSEIKSMCEEASTSNIQPNPCFDLGSKF